MSGDGRRVEAGRRGTPTGAPRRSLVTPAGIASEGDARATAIWAVLAVGLLLRVACSFHAFWLDEIWSYLLAQDLASPWQIFTERRHDNNHILNTLFIHAIGEHEHWFPYRLLSIATGTASIYFLARLAAERGKSEALAAAILAATAYPLISVSAQARGYAPAIFFSLVAVWLARRERTDRAATRLAFWSACVLGILSHLTFLYAYLSIVAWTLVRPAIRARWKELAWLHCVPVAAIAALYWFFYRDIVIGGGPADYDLWAVVGRAIAEAVGVSPNRPGVGLALAVAAPIALIGIGGLLRTARADAVFFGCALFAAPAALFVASEPRLLYSRYFVASVPFFYWLCAVALGWIRRRGRIGLGLYWGMLAAFALAHGGTTLEHASVGRSHYSDALTYLEQHTDSAVIGIGTDHDFRNSLVLRFYARYRTAGKTFAVRESGSWTGPGPQWYLAHSWLSGPDPPPTLRFEGDRRYTLVERFENGVGPGWTWFLYRNDAR